MGTTQFRGEADEGDRVRHAQGRPLYEMDVNILGEIEGNGWPAGSKFRGTLPSSVYKKSDGVNGNEYHTV